MWHVKIVDMGSGDVIRQGTFQKEADAKQHVDAFCMSLFNYRVVEDFSTTNRAHHLTVCGNLARFDTPTEFHITTWMVL